MCAVAVSKIVHLGVTHVGIRICFPSQPVFFPPCHSDGVTKRDIFRNIPCDCGDMHGLI